MIAIYSRANDENVLNMQERCIRTGTEMAGIARTQTLLFSDIGGTGKSIDRPGMNELRAALKEQDIECVFVWGSDRIATQYDQLALFLQEAKDAGVKVKACSHITGGGFYENVPRMLHDGVHAVIKKDSYEVPAIFKLMQKKGNIDEHMMYNTYNMGIGMIVAVDPADVDKTMEAIKAAGETCYVIGEIKDGEKGVTLC